MKITDDEAKEEAWRSLALINRTIGALGSHADNHEAINKACSDLISARSRVQEWLRIHYEGNSR